jgi:hypothetical protein
MGGGNQMKLGSINVVVKDPEEALKTFLKIFGTNNIKQVIKIKGLSDTVDTVDGYYLKMKLTNLGIFTPRESTGRMGEFLKKNGEGIHHIEFHLGQDEFEHTYSKFKTYGWAVSEKPIWFGKFSAAIFWLEESGDQHVPIKFATTAYKLIGKEGEEALIPLDTPKSFEKINITEEYLRPRVELNTIVVATNEFERQQQIWTAMVSEKPREMGDQFRLERGEVHDGRGDIFVPVFYMFGSGAEVTRVNMYTAINPDGPINKFLTRKGKGLVYHNMTSFVTRDKIHQYWKQLEEAGIAMVDPKPLLLTSTGNYFFFVHPISTHGVTCEFVSIFTRDEAGRMRFDFSDSEVYWVPPEMP